MPEFDDMVSYYGWIGLVLHTFMCMECTRRNAPFPALTPGALRFLRAVGADTRFQQLQRHLMGYAGDPISVARSLDALETLAFARQEDKAGRHARFLAAKAMYLEACPTADDPPHVTPPRQLPPLSPPDE